MADSPRWPGRLTIALVVGGAWAFLLSYFRPSLLLLDTTIAGGDTPSFLAPVHHLRDVLLPAGMPLGWDLGNFAGYAPYQFYFLPPSLIIIALSLAIPFNVAFKLVTALGSFLLPLTTALAVRALGYAPEVAAIGAAGSLVFLFNEGNSMWGGNIPSTLAGEFAHSLGFAFAVLFIGLLYRGIHAQRGWRSAAAALAFAGLCHPIAFLNGATPGAYFLLERRRIWPNLRHLLRAYGTAVLLMGFWLFPLMAKLGYATSINWKWVFQSWRDVTPRVLGPVFWVAAADIVWVSGGRRAAGRPLLAGIVAAAVTAVLYFGRGALGVPELRFVPVVPALLVLLALLHDELPLEPARYLLTATVLTVVLFFNATAVGLPEIRFVPFVYFLAILLALDLVARLLARIPAAPLAAIALSVGIAAWVQSNVTFIPTWMRWNYEGLERKPSWPLLASIMGAVRGTVHDPRVAYENSPAHERFGSMRVFEDTPLLSGRSTLEGVLLQTAVTSPFIYWLQSQISKQGTGVIPGYSYPSMDLAHATPRLDLFNATDMIAVTPEVIGALDKDPRWRRIFSSPPYVIFRRNGADPHYVRVPRYQPVLVETRRWKQDFHRWFATDGALEVPIVAAATVPAAERARFPLGSTSPTVLPKQPIAAHCDIDERVDHLDIEFTTTCPGLPHWIAVSYSPNWQVEGADRIYLVSPAFMLVFPNGPHVHLRYRRIAADWIGIALSLVGLVLCLAPGGRRLAAEASPAWLVTLQPYFVAAVAIALLAATAWNVLRDVAPARFYQEGWHAFERQDYATAQRYFERSILFGGESNTAADATFFRAASLLRAGKPAEALLGYQAVIDRFPGSMWVAESHYHVGLCLRQLGRLREARDRFRFVVSTYPGNRWAGLAAEQLEQIHAEARARGRRG